MTMTVAITNPVVTHVICSTVTPSDPVRCGTATLTIDASIAPISVPNVIETVTSHLLTGGRAGVGIAPFIVVAVTCRLRELSSRVAETTRDPRPTGDDVPSA